MFVLFLCAELTSAMEYDSTPRRGGQARLLASTEGKEEKWLRDGIPPLLSFQGFISHRYPVIRLLAKVG